MLLSWVGRALRARRWADGDTKLSWRTDGSESRPYQRAGNQRGTGDRIGSCGVALGRAASPSPPLGRSRYEAVLANGRLGEPSLPSRAGNQRGTGDRIGSCGVALGRAGSPSPPVGRWRYEGLLANGRLGEPSLPPRRSREGTCWHGDTGARGDGVSKGPASAVS
jgi:hypothetical protein